MKLNIKVQKRFEVKKIKVDKTQSVFAHNKVGLL